MKKLFTLLAVIFCLNGWAQCSINIAGSPTICAGSSGTFSLSGASTYTWAPATGLSNTNGAIVTITPSNSITYTIIGTTGTCVATNTLAVTVNPLPTVSISPVPAGCVPLCTSFTVNATPIIGSYLWDFGNGQTSTSASPNVCYNVAANAIVTLTVTSTQGCVNTATTSVVTNATPAITVASPSFFCAGDNVPSPIINTSPSSGVTCSWSVSNVNIGLPASGSGIPAPYTAPANSSLVNQVGIVTYTATLGSCTNTASETITIKPTPIIQSIANMFYCPGQFVPQINFSCSPSGGSPVFSWSTSNSLGISQIGNIPPFTATNTTSVSSVVTFTVSASLNNCPSAFSSFAITIYPNPVANFSSNIVCEGMPTNFTDLSTPNTGSITVNQWAWDMNNDGVFGDATAQNPQYIISPPGSNTVGLFVSTNSIPSCTSIITQTVLVNPLPFATYTLTQNAAPFTWDAFATYPANTASATWDWGDGTNTTGLYPSHTYSATNRYNICVTVTDNSGCSGNTCQNDTIYRLAQNNSTNSNMLYVNVLQSATGISQISNINTQILVYPNPSNGLYTIQTNTFDNTSVEVYNLLGEKLFIDKLQSNATQINLSSLANGMYQLRLIKNNKTVYQSKISKVD